MKNHYFFLLWISMYFVTHCLLSARIVCCPHPWSASIDHEVCVLVVLAPSWIETHGRTRIFSSSRPFFSSFSEVSFCVACCCTSCASTTYRCHFERIGMQIGQDRFFQRQKKIDSARSKIYQRFHSRIDHCIQSYPLRCPASKTQGVSSNLYPSVEKQFSFRARRLSK